MFAHKTVFVQSASEDACVPIESICSDVRFPITSGIVPVIFENIIVIENTSRSLSHLMKSSMQ